MSAFSLKMDIAENRFFYRRNIPAVFAPAGATGTTFSSKKIVGYKPTPLYALKSLAALFGVSTILVKDESQRFGLNAFKMLGGAYAIAQLLCEKYHLDINAFSFATFKSSIKEKMTFATTTDGNHGRGVAWAAQQLGQNAVIYMPKGSAQERVDAILRLGARCIVTEMNYDDTVRFTMQTARQNGWEVVQDTAWEGYTKIPTWIMQGYATLADEAVEQMAAMGIARPTTFSCRLASARWPAACSVIWWTSSAHAICIRLSLSQSWRIVSTVQASKVKSSTLAAAWPRLWQAWPAANPIRWAGTFCATAPPSLSPVRMP